MTTRPLILRGPQVRAALDGRLSAVIVPLREQPQDSAIATSLYNGRWRFTDRLGIHAGWVKPPFAPGDVLWCRETWAQYPIEMFPERDSDIWYQADGRAPPSDHKLHRWRLPQWMPKWASRLALIVGDVQVLRVQDVSGEQAERCAPEWLSPPISNECFEDFDKQMEESWRYSLWCDLDGRHGEGTCARNPWCALAGVTVRHGNVDVMEAAE